MRLALIALVLLLAVTFSQEKVFKSNGSKPFKPTKPVPKPPKPPSGNGSMLPRPRPRPRPVPVPVPVPVPAPIRSTTRRTTPKPKVCTTDTECGYRQFCRDKRCRRGPTGTGVSCSASVFPSTCGVNRTCVDYECSCKLDSHCVSNEICDGRACQSRGSSDSYLPFLIGGLLLGAAISVIVAIARRR